MSEMAISKTPVQTDQPAVPALFRHVQNSVDSASATNGYSKESKERSNPTSANIPQATEPSQIIRNKDQEAREKQYAFWKEKFGSSKWAKLVHEVAIRRYRVLYEGKKWPDAVPNLRSAPPEFQRLVMEVTEYLELREEFEGSDAEDP
jgi:hypothetical protein